MEWGGLSMALGAFVAGVLLSESSFRHQLGRYRALPRPAAGPVLPGGGHGPEPGGGGRNWPLIVAGVLALMVGKALCIYLVARFAKSPHAEAMDRAILMAQGGEFAFVLFTEALKLRVMDAEVNANMTAIVVLSMALTPLVVVLYKRWARADALSLDGVEAPQDLQGNVLIIGFGRVGQIASQGPLAKGCSCPSSTTTRTPSARRRCMASRSITATVRGRTSCMRQGQARPGHRRLRGRQGRGHPHRGERAARMPACANGGAGLRPGTCAGAGAPRCRPCGARDL
jgi:hypothetical protein